METFKTRFDLSGVPTDVTVQVADTNIFACTLNFADFFDGGEREGTNSEPDLVLQRSDEGSWQRVGEGKVTLNAFDLENLEKAIDEAYLSQK